MKTRYAVVAVCFLSLACLAGCGASKTPPVAPEPPLKLTPPPPPEPPAFPALDKPFFAAECYYLKPNGKDPRAIVTALDDDGDVFFSKMLIYPDSLRELMKKLEPALKAQKADPNAVQLVCFPLEPGSPSPPRRSPPKPSTGPGSTEKSEGKGI